MKTKIKVYNYGDYSSNNYGANSLAFVINDVTFYFSYETCIAFEVDCKLYISKNVWSTTTGKHLNWIEPNKSKRLEYEVFQKELNSILDKLEIKI